MTSTYLHVNCVVGVACAEAFANTNIASGGKMYLPYDSIPYAFEPLVVFIIRGKKPRECMACRFHI